MSTRNWTTEETSCLLRFCTQKCSDVQLRMSFASIALEYTESSQSNRTAKSIEKKVWKLLCTQLIYKFCRIRGIVSAELEKGTSDHGTKVKLAVVLTRPITEDFLRSIRQHADVELNEKRQIVKFKGRKDTVIDFDNVSHYENAPKTQNVKKLDNEHLMMDLLSKLSDEHETISNTRFMQKYKEHSKTTDSERSIERAYSKVKLQVFQSTKYDMSAKIKMLFYSKARIEKDVLAELQKEGVVVVDGIKNAITIFTSNDGSIKLGVPIEDMNRRRKVNSLDSRISTMQVNNESDDESENADDIDNNPHSSDKPSCFWMEPEEQIGVKSVLQFISDLSRSIVLPEGPQLTSMEELLTEVEKTYRTEKDKQILTSTILMFLYVELLKNVNAATTTPPTIDEFLNIEIYLKMFLDTLRYIQSDEVEKYRSGLTNTLSSFKRTKKMVPVVDVIETLRSVFKFVVDYLKSD